MFVGTGIDDFGIGLSAGLRGHLGATRKWGFTTANTHIGLLHVWFNLRPMYKLLKVLTFRNICSALFKSKFLAEKEKRLS